MARSPNYPAVSLKEAIESVRSVYAKEHRNTMNVDVAAQDMGYSGRSGASLRRIGALRHYGLLTGRGDEIRVSDDAVTILADEETGSAERAEALVRCAEHPELFQEVKESFPTVPSHANLRAFLEKRKFTRKAADKAADIYRDTMEFVRNETSGYNTDILSTEQNANTGGYQDETPQGVSNLPIVAPTPRTGVRTRPSAIEEQGLSEIEYIRVSKRCGIRLLADGPYEKRDIEKVVSRLQESLEDGVYDDLAQLVDKLDEMESTGED